MHSIKFYGMRRQRSSWIGYEIHRHAGSGFINFWIGNPNKHCFWAFSIWMQYQY